jgi:hypothetical protein
MKNEENLKLNKETNEPDTICCTYEDLGYIFPKLKKTHRDTAGLCQCSCHSKRSNNEEKCIQEWLGRLMDEVTTFNLYKRSASFTMIFYDCKPHGVSETCKSLCSKVVAKFSLQQLRADFNILDKLSQRRTWRSQKKIVNENDESVNENI